MKENCGNCDYFMVHHVGANHGKCLIDHETSKAEYHCTDWIKCGNIQLFEFSKCPKCGQQSVKTKGLNEGGGVACITPGCNYWFCY